MRFRRLSPKVTRARPTSNMMYSAAAIAVVSEVNPDEPGAFFFDLLSTLLLLTLCLLFFSPSGHTAPLPQTAMQRASYNNTLLSLTPMLFHRIELGLSYEAVVNIVGKSALYCDSGDSSCSAENGAIAQSCLDSEFIQANKTWFCHWDGKQANSKVNSRLEVWFVGQRSAQVFATMPDGNIYRRDSSNTVGLERHSA